jgi:hypothetical protein
MKFVFLRKKEMDVTKFERLYSELFENEVCLCRFNPESVR